MVTAGAWGDVAAHIEKRLRAMRVYGNLSEIARQSGVSDATWRKLLDGEPVNRIPKRRQVCFYLGWTDDSIEAILAGREPERIDPQPADDLSGARPLPDRVGALEERFDTLESRFLTIEDQVSQLLAAIRKSRERR